VAGPAKLLQRLRSVGPRAKHPPALAFDQPAGNERELRVAPGKRELSHPLVRDDGVLVLAEDVLDIFGAVDETARLLADSRLRERAFRERAGGEARCRSVRDREP
jgi:hypothetical protein